MEACLHVSASFLYLCAKKNGIKSKQLQLLNELHNMKNPLPLIQLPCHQITNDF